MTAWRSALAALAEDVIARDGATIRRSLERADGKGAMPVVSAWASTNELVRAQLKVDDQSNESTALPELLAMLHLHGSVGTMDAMGCQGERARQISDQGGAYGLSLQEHQPGLPRECEELFAWLRGPHPLDEEVVLGYDEQGAGGHERIETRKVWSTEALEGLGTCERWPGLATLVMVEATRQRGDQESLARRYYLSAC